jgi:virginiamycin B lyase
MAKAAWAGLAGQRVHLWKGASLRKWSATALLGSAAMVAGPWSTVAASAGPTVTEFTLPAGSSSPGMITAGPDGALWFTESGKIGRITTAGTVSEFPAPAGGSDGIAAGPDGALWFTEGGANKIGRMTMSGAVSEFPTLSTTSNPVGLPNSSANPFGITAGPDGALWFTESLADKIGRITTAGIVSEFPLPHIQTVHDNPEGITKGPDGALWFTEALGQRIGRIDPTTHAITEFPPPTTGAGPVGLTSIVSGPEGALWFTSNAEIDRITTAGATTKFSVPNASTAGGEIVTAGSDGALWFTESQAKKIGRMTSAGSVTEFALPTAGDLGSPSGITAGPDGAIWFTEGRANRIGRVATPSPSPSPGHLPVTGSRVAAVPAAGLAIALLLTGAALIVAGPKRLSRIARMRAKRD